MSIPDYLRPVPEIPAIMFPLEEDTRNLIEMNYSASTCPNIETMAKPPDSPQTSLSKASEYLVKMNQKGYMVLQGVPPEQIRRSFNRSLKPTILSNKHILPPKLLTTPKATAKSSFNSPAKGETPIKLCQLKQRAINSNTTASTTDKMKLDSSVSAFSVSSQSSTPQKNIIKKSQPQSPLVENSRFKDPELHFFLTSNVLKKMKKKISSLPFIIEEDVYVYVSKLEEKVVEIGHRMIHMRMLDSHKLTRSQLQQNTQQFVIEVQQAGNEIIKSVFKADLINLELAAQNKDLVKEFPEFFPNKQNENNKGNTKNKYVPSTSSPILSNFSSKSFQSQGQFLNTTNSSISATDNTISVSNSTEKTVEFNIAKDEAILRLFDPSKKSNDLPIYYRPNVNELKKPEYGITTPSKSNTTVSTKKKLKKIANAFEEVLSRPSTASSVQYSELDDQNFSNDGLCTICENDSSSCLILNLNLCENQNLNRKMPQVITNDFKRKPKAESKSISSRAVGSSRKRSRSQNNDSNRTHPICLPSLKDSFLSSREGVALCSTINTIANGREYQTCYSKRREKEIVDKDIANKLFWEVADPLGKSREGQFIDQLDTIDKLSSEIDLNEIVTEPDISNYHPFDFESLPDGQLNPINASYENDEYYNNIGEQKSIFCSENDDSKSNDNNNNESNSNNENNNDQSTAENYDAYSFSYLRNSSRNINLIEPMIGSYDISKSKTRIVTYLQQHESDFDGDINQSPIYQRLDKIWEELGFTINQKLEMVLKYSKTAEESSKLSEALDAWENAFANIKNYQLTYKNMQTFLTNEALVVLPKKRDMLFAQLNDDLKTAIENVNRSASYLKSTYGDELLMKRKKVSDLIGIRNIKLKMLISKIGIVQQENV